MLKKLLKFLIGAAGAVAGYGIFHAVEFLYTTISGHEIDFLNGRQLEIFAITFGLICGIIFFEHRIFFGGIAKTLRKA